MQNIELRDWFAGMALGHLPQLWDPERTAINVTRAYVLADAILAARGPAKPRAMQPGDLTEWQRHMIWRGLMSESAESERDPCRNSDRAREYRDLAEKFAAEPPAP